MNLLSEIIMPEVHNPHQNANAIGIIIVGIIIGAIIIAMFIRLVIKTTKEHDNHNDQTKKFTEQNQPNKLSTAITPTIQQSKNNYITCDYCGCKYKKEKEILKCPNCNALTK